MGEITVILLLALIFLGPAKLPDLATGLGKLIREIRKATSDIKNEITLDDTFRKPFEELRDAVTLHPDELKRRDQLKKMVEEARLRDEAEARETAAATAAIAAAAATPAIAAAPDAPVSAAPVSAAPASAAPVWAPPVSGAAVSSDPASLPGSLPSVPIDAPLDGQPLPPIPSPILPPVGPPAGTVARTRAAPSAQEAVGETAGSATATATATALPAGIMTSAPPPSHSTPISPSPLGGPPRVTTPISSLSGDRANITQSLTEADLLPGAQPRRKRPTPPPLPGLDRGATPAPPIGHLGPPRVTPPISSLSGGRANVTQVLSESDLLPPAEPETLAGAPKPPPLPGSKKT